MRRAVDWQVSMAQRPAACRMACPLLPFEYRIVRARCDSVDVAVAILLKGVGIEW